MASIVGIDEAGYGPVLGPLVVSAVVIDLPAATVRSETLRAALGDSIAISGRACADAIIVDDSKKVYGGRQRKLGVARLERGVLAALATAGRRPSCLADLLATIAPGAAAEMAELPWYAGGQLALPLAADETNIDRGARRLGAGLAGIGAGALEVYSEVVFEPRFNDRVTELDNKATVLFETCSDVLRRVAQIGGDISVHVDRHGGRSRYHPLLQRSFPHTWVWTVGEDARCSAYRIEGPSTSMSVSFEVEAERSHLAVALASMVSKYVRELFIELLNRFWQRRCPGLGRTTGYWSDAIRFLTEVAPFLTADGFTVDVLRRVR